MSVRKHFILIREIGAAGIYQVDTGEVVFLGDVLSTQMLFHRDGEVGTTFDRCVIDDDDALLPVNPPDACNDTGGRYIIFAVHVVRSQLREFEKRRAWIYQCVDPVAR